MLTLRVVHTVSSVVYNQLVAAPKYLITGGYGLIGSALANSIKQSVAIVSRSDEKKSRVNNPQVLFIKKSLNELTPQDVEGVEIIYHCASTVDNYHVLTDPYTDVETNIAGSIHLLECLKDLPQKPKLIYLSTFFVYGNEYDRSKEPINEESRTDPLAIYPATKLCTESIIKLYSKLYDIPYLICRLTNVYSQNEAFDNKKKGALNYLIMQAIKGEPLKIYRGGNFYRDYIHVDDVVSALRFLERGAQDDLYLIGNGTPVRFMDIINFVRTQSNSVSTVEEIDPPKFHQIVGISNFVADTKKITQLGWKAKIDYKAGLQLVISRYQSLIK